MRRARVALLLAGLWLPAASLTGLDRLEVEVADLQGEGWQAGGVRLTLDLGRPDAAGMTLDVAALRLPPPLEGIRRARAECRATVDETGRLQCPDAQLRVWRQGAPPVALAAHLAVDPSAGRISLSLRRQPLLGGHIDLDLEAGPGALALFARVAGLEAAPLSTLARLALAEPPVTVSAGRLSGSVSLRQRPGRLALDLELEAAGLAFSDDTGLRAGEGVGLTLTVRGQGPPRAWSARVRATLTAGAVYVHPVLLQVSQGPLTVALSAERRDQELHVVEIEAEDPGVARVQGAARLALGTGVGLLALDLQMAPAPAAGIYQRYLKAFTGAGVMSDLSVSGRAAGEISWRRAGPSAARLSLDELSLGDSAGRFALLGVAGELNWSRQQPVRESRLAWTSAQVGRLGFGAARVAISLDDREARLLAPVKVALLDGSLHLERLEARALGEPGQRLEADLSLSPLSLERLSERLAWPPLAGSIQGRVPRLVYQGSRLSVDGDLELGLFDGRVRVSNLSLEDPFGVVPRLRADVAADDIDLAVLTRALSFGSIEGRLEARVSSLVLERWQPVAFDALLRTPPGDTSRRRISQRAVDNLASLGGANAVLSSTFLRVFSEFSYERLGLSCRLQGGICEMGGVEPVDGGYYLVKGGGLPPRVDVVGYNRRVDWPTLLERLRAVASAEGPVVR